MLLEASFIQENDKDQQESSDNDSCPELEARYDLDVSMDDDDDEALFGRQPHSYTHTYRMGNIEMESDSNSEDDHDMSPLIFKPFDYDSDSKSDEEVKEDIHESVNTVPAFETDDWDEWLVDSGAIVNVTRGNKYLKNVTMCNQQITGGNGEKVSMEKQGEIMLKEKKMRMGV
jgi:hypothetical protein